MTRYATAARWAAQAGPTPSDNESARNRKKAPTRKGNKHLHAAMVEHSASPISWEEHGECTGIDGRWRRR